MKVHAVVFGTLLCLVIAWSIQGTVAAPAPATTPAAAPAPPAAPATPIKTSTIDFNRDIRPIISDNCFYCHGPDKGHRKAELRLDIKEGIFGAKDDAYPVVPGKPDDSVLYMRITSDDPDYKMPHKDSNKRLTPAQIATIKQWIEEGAEWKGHWAYIPPTRGEAPTTAAVEGFNRNPIDNF